MHVVAPAATLRVVLLPANVLDRAATATADMLAGLRLAVPGTDVALISFSLGEPGWDPVTGWGSPNTQVLVPLLASQPLASQPLASQPLASQPLASQPLASQPLASQPLASQPLASQPLASQPLAT